MEKNTQQSKRMQQHIKSSQHANQPNTAVHKPLSTTHKRINNNNNARNKRTTKNNETTTPGDNANQLNTIKQLKSETLSLKKELKGYQNMQIGESCTYFDSLCHPDKARDSRIPSTLDIKTVSFHRHVTLPFKTNANGIANVVWGPQFVAEDGVDLSQIVLNNDDAYDGINSANNQAKFIKLNWNIPVNQIQGYRIVSANMKVAPQSSALNLKGKLVTAAFNYKFYPAAANAIYADPRFGQSAVVEQSEHAVAIANIAAAEGTSALYCPIDIQDFEMFDINTNEAKSSVGAAVPVMQPILSSVITGAQGNADFVAEFYLNFEATPELGSLLQGLGRKSYETALPQQIIREFRATHHLTSVIKGFGFNQMQQAARMPEDPVNLVKNNTGDINHVHPNGVRHIEYKHGDHTDANMWTIPSITTEYHAPGFNYLGPGTNIERRIIRGDKPVNYYDKLALEHDINYLRGPSYEKEADRIMIGKLPPSSGASVLTIPNMFIHGAFSLKNALGLQFSAKDGDDKLADYYNKMARDKGLFK